MLTADKFRDAVTAHFARSRKVYDNKNTPWPDPKL